MLKQIGNQTYRVETMPKCNKKDCHQYPGNAECEYCMYIGVGVQRITLLSLANALGALIKVKGEK